MSVHQDADHQIPSGAEPSPARLNTLVASLLSFCLIVFGVWLVWAGKRYRDEYSNSVDGWRIGSTRSVELTLVRTDKDNLSCASDITIDGLHCAFRRDLAAVSGSADDPRLLQPYNTTSEELLLGAGLWTSPEMQGALPAARFTVVCNYHVQGVMRSAAIRFASAAPFAPVGKIVTAGSLTDCVLPR